MTNWLEVFRCSDCGGDLTSLGVWPDSVTCNHCGRTFSQDEGVWFFHPTAVLNKEGKDKEQQGWERKDDAAAESGWEPPADHYLKLPDQDPHPYYQAAAWYLRIVMAYGGVWSGKRVLELGAAECWATRRFAEAGADAIALDYDPRRMKKARIILESCGLDFPRVAADAEKLPFLDGCFDRVFCCSVLHHFFNLKKAIGEIARVLKPGGIFFGIHEAFHPPYYSRRRILEMSPDTIPNIEEGINERSYAVSHYRKLFCDAGLSMELIHPRWDTREDGEELRVSPNTALQDRSSYESEWLWNLSSRPGVVGAGARLLKESGLWRIALHPRLFPLIRFQILNWTTRDKILVARKPL